MASFTQDEAAELYRAHHILLHPKYLDPCPTVVIEALASGLPIVASGSGGLPELVPSSCGELIPAPLSWEELVTPTGEQLAAAVEALLPGSFRPHAQLGCMPKRAMTVPSGSKARGHFPPCSRMSEPAVTVLMTVYNAGSFLEPSIRSILGQSFGDFEFLIVDDCSTDGSAELAESASKDPRIKVIRNAQNRGQTACLNLGLGLARGRWIARHDADDLAHRDRLALQFQSAQKLQVALLGTNGRIINEQNKLVGLLDAPLYEGITWSAPFLNRSCTLRSCFAPTSFGMNSADTIKATASRKITSSGPALSRDTAAPTFLSA